MAGRRSPDGLLEPVISEPIRWVVRAAVGDGDAVDEVVKWSAALVVHMRGGLSAGLRDRVRARFPDLAYFEQPGSMHYEPDEGFIDNGFSVSFPRKRR